MGAVSARARRRPFDPVHQFGLGSRDQLPVGCRRPTSRERPSRRASLAHDGTDRVRLRSRPDRRLPRGLSTERSALSPPSICSRTAGSVSARWRRYSAGSISSSRRSVRFRPATGTASPHSPSMCRRPRSSSSSPDGRRPQQLSTAQVVQRRAGGIPARPAPGDAEPQATGVTRMTNFDLHLPKVPRRARARKSV